MKKIIVCLLTLSFIFTLLVGCKKQEQFPDSNEITSMYHIASYENLDKLTNTIKTAKQKQENNQELSQDDMVLVTLEQLYKPAVDIPNYTMYSIDVSKYYVRYWYCPNDLEHSQITSSDQLLSITYQRPKDGVDQFEQAIVQYREQSNIAPTEEGVLYDAECRSIAFRLGTSYGYIKVPESMNTYETILPLCQYELVEISNSTEAETAN